MGILWILRGKLASFIRRVIFGFDMKFSRFWSRNKRPLFVIALFLGPLLSLFLMRVPLPRINVYDTLTSYVVHPSAEGVNNVETGLGVVWDHYIGLVNAARENDLLKKENGDLKQKIIELQERVLEGDRLRSILSFRDEIGAEAVAAKLIGQNVGSESFSFLINVGEKDGIKVRMPVVTNEGVVGTISKVYPHYSALTALVDPSHDVDGVVVRSRARFIVEGRGNPLVGRLKYLDRSDDVRVGDLALTSGLDGIFPKGLVIGHIVRVDRPRAGIMQEAEIRPSVDVGRLEEVLVLKTVRGVVAK